jgi:hypothetical protein
LKRRPIGLALAGGGPFGAIHELAALFIDDELRGALQDLRRSI